MSATLFDELWQTCVELNIPVSFHTGTTGSGAGMAGGGGMRIYYSHPMHLDELAARYPTLTIIGCHPSVPWADDMLPIAVHKKNVLLILDDFGLRKFTAQQSSDFYDVLVERHGRAFDAHHEQPRRRGVGCLLR